MREIEEENNKKHMLVEDYISTALTEDSSQKPYYESLKNKYKNKDFVSARNENEKEIELFILSLLIRTHRLNIPNMTVDNYLEVLNNLKLEMRSEYINYINAVQNFIESILSRL